MATVKVLNAAGNADSFTSNYFKSIFSCCFTGNSKNSNEPENGSCQTNLEKEEEIVREEGTNCSSANSDCGESSLVEEEERDSILEDSRDSAIDSASLSSQLNLREGLTDDEKMRGDEQSNIQEDKSSHLSRNFDGTQKDEMSDQTETKTETTDVQGNDLSSDPRSLTQTEISVEGPNEEAIGTNESNNSLDNDASQETSTDQPSVQCGTVRMTFVSNADRGHWSVTIHEAKDIPGSGRVNLSHSEIHLLLNLPSKKIRHKTKAKTGENPHFEETFRFRVPPEGLSENGFRMRLYRSETLKKERMMGETFINVSSILNARNNNPLTVWITLEPRFNIMSSKTAGEDQTDAGLEDSSPLSVSASELMLGLAYNSSTGRLTVEVIQGSKFKSSSSQRPPDAFVKLKLISPDGKEITRSKTTVKRKQPNPSFKEIFMFHVPSTQLPHVSLMISLCEHHNIKQSQILGWFMLGHTNSSEETKRHWEEMIDKKGELITKWHPLLNP